MLLEETDNKQENKYMNPVFQDDRKGGKWLEKVLVYPGLQRGHVWEVTLELRPEGCKGTSFGQRLF